MIHQYRLNGHNIVLDVDSGHLHRVDDLVYEIIRLYDTHREEERVEVLAKSWPKEEIREAYQDVQMLVDTGMLFSKEDHEARLADRKAGQSSVIKALCLNVAHSCNLNCNYCFAAQGTYKGEEAIMSPETGRRAIDFLIAHSGTRRNLEVDFFGGEPLMNWEMVKETVAYARSKEEACGKHFRFTLTTNGLLINDDVIAFTNQEMDNVVLSLDGRKETHDRFRVTGTGRGCYDVVVPKFQALVKARTWGSYYMRGTYTRHNLDFLNDILHIADLGFDEISMEPVVSPPGEPYALREEDLPFLKRQYEELALEMLKRKREGRGFHFYHFTVDLENGPCIYKRIAGCGSGTEYFAVTPKGDLYPCHQLVDDPDFLMGHVTEGLQNLKLREAFSACHIFAKPECQACWAKYYCSGGCAANAYHVTGQLGGIDAYGCELFRKRMECALMMKVDEAVRETD